MAGGALSIKLRCASWQQLATIYKRDLSRGTMFLRASSPPPIGTSVKIDLTLPSASVVTLTGVVQEHVEDAQRGAGVELKLAPIATHALWMIESALASEVRSPATPATGVPVVLPPTTTGPVATLTDGAEVATAEDELIRALVAEADSLKKLNPFLVLGLGYEATDNDVRAAFGELTKRYHPDRFARYESPQLRALAAEIFILIRDAYRRIGDAHGRAQTLTALGRAPAPRAVPAPRQTGATPVVPPTPFPAAKSQLVPTMAQTPPPKPVTEPVQRPTPPQPAQPRPPADPDPEALLDAERVDDALAAFKALAKKYPNDRTPRAGIELCEGMKALAARDRLEAAQRFEAALEIDPSNERAARELADMRRQATNERKGLLSRLMGKKDT
jgi:tetratricopeptide (TPR) repeat protein